MVRVDALIAGAGPAGIAAAWTLLRGGARVLVVDRGLRRPILGESLPPVASLVLQRLGIPQGTLEGPHLPSYGNRSMWGSPSLTTADFILQPYGHGWHLDRPAFECNLRHAVCDHGAEIWEPARVTGWSRNGRGGWSVGIRTAGGIVQAETDFLIDATGRSRQIARGLGVQRQVHDQAVAITCVLAPREEGEDDATTLVEAVEDGWWYASPLPDGHLVLGFVTDADTEATSRARTALGWIGGLRATTAIRRRTEGYEPCPFEDPAIAAAGSSHLISPAGLGWCAVGDAAAAHDPLSSRGIVAALMSGAEGAQAILAGEAGLDAYVDRMQDAYARYLAEWLAHYAIERRWPHSPFWQRRHTMVDALLG